MHNFNFKTFFYEVSKEILDKSEKIKKQKNIEKNIKLTYFDDITNILKCKTQIGLKFLITPMGY